MRSILLSLAILCGPVHADAGVAADAVTTGIALSATGVVETNPIGLATVPIRLVVIEHAKTLPPEEGTPILHAINATSWGAAANNLLVLAKISAAPLVGVLVTFILWNQGKEEREFAQLCALHKQIEGKNLTCVYRS